MPAKRHITIAEFVDSRTGKRFFPTDEVLPPLDAKRAAKLIKAECIEVMDPDAPELPIDALDATSDAGLAQIAKDENVDITGAEDREAIIALIRTARETAATDLTTLDHDGLVAKAQSLSIDIATNASDDDIRKAISTKLAA